MLQKSNTHDQINMYVCFRICSSVWLTCYMHVLKFSACIYFINFYNPNHIFLLIQNYSDLSFSRTLLIRFWSFILILSFLFAWFYIFNFDYNFKNKLRLNIYKKNWNDRCFSLNSNKGDVYVFGMFYIWFMVDMSD